MLTLEDARGNRGVGEASPLPGHSPDTLHDCREELSRIGQFPIDPFAHPPLGSPAATFALETAWLDLAAQRERRSISELLGRHRERVPISALLTAEDPSEAIREARLAIARGIRTLKIKVARRSLREDLALVRALRDAFGDDLALRLDANRRWSLDAANRALIAMEPFAPELVEEPAHDWGRLDACVPLALDESLIDMDADQIRTLASQKVVSALILKPMLLGGFSRCLELAHLAEELGLACVVTHLFDGPIAMAAAAELALALPGRVLACGLDRHPRLPEGSIIPQLRESEIRPHGSIGLGVSA